MTTLFTATINGLITGAIYAIAASGLVITYATSNVFNMAHGTIGMFMAFLYWQMTGFRDQGGWGPPSDSALTVDPETWDGVGSLVPFFSNRFVALIVVVFILAPLFGALLERGMMRRLTEASVTVSLTTTVALFIGLLGLAQAIWPPSERAVTFFFAGSNVGLGRVNVSAHQIITFVFAAGLAAGLYLLLNRTRTGIAMRAVVDNRVLLALHGAIPGLLGMLSWGIGSAAAALAGILIVPEVQLDYITLTLLVINAYAAAMVGKLTSLPRTFVGAMILGLGTSYFLAYQRNLTNVIDADWFKELITGVRGALPTIFMLIVLLLLPQERLRVGAVAGAVLAPLSTRLRALQSSGGLVGAVVLLTFVFSTANTARLGQSLVFAMVMLSMVVLSGYGGDVSLMQMSFVGVGALVAGRWFGTVNIWSILVALILTAIIGGLLAFPAARLRGLYLGLFTLALAFGFDKLIFQRSWGFRGADQTGRPDLLLFDISGEAGYTIAMAVVFCIMALLTLAIRRGRFGRFVLAARDSQAACATLGLSITRIRVAVFAISAAMAGVTGVFFAGMNTTITGSDVEMLRNLPILLLVVIGGLTSVTGALIGGLMLGLLPALQEFTGTGGSNISIAVLAAVLATKPNGLSGYLFILGRRLFGDRGSSSPGPEVMSGPPNETILLEPEVEVVAAT